MPFCEKPQNLPRLNSWFTKYKVSRRLTTHWHKLVPPYISACTPQCQAVWQYQEMAQKDRDAVFFLLMNPVLPWHSQILQKTMPQLHRYQSVIDWWSDGFIQTAAPKTNASPPQSGHTFLSPLCIVLSPFTPIWQGRANDSSNEWSDCLRLLFSYYNILVHSANRYATAQPHKPSSSH